MEDWSYYYNLGIDNKDVGLFEASLEAHLTVLVVEPDLEMPEAWHNIGAAYLRLNDTDKAKPYLEQSLIYYDKIIATIRKVDAKYEAEMERDVRQEMEIDQVSLASLGLEDELGIETQKRSPFFDEDFPAFYEYDRPAYYLYWKAGALALLTRFDEALDLLKIAIEEDEFYALEAENEEDFVAMQNDQAFQALIQPIITLIKQPNHPQLFELYEYIEQFVLLGFDSPLDGVEMLHHQFTNEFPEPIPKAWIRMVLEDLYEKHFQNSKKWQHPTAVERLGAAFLDMWVMGIVSMHCVGDSELEARETVNQFVDAGIFKFDVAGYCCYDKAQILQLLQNPNAFLELYTELYTEDAIQSAKITQQIIELLESHGLQVAKEKCTSSMIVLKAFHWQKVFVDLDNSDMFEYWDTLHPAEDNEEDED